MKKIAFILICTFINITSYAQRDSLEINTKIERAIYSTSEVYKIELIDIAEVSNIKFRAVVADNLKTNETTKGVMIGNDFSYNIWTGKSKKSKITYLDYNEIETLQKFFENCDKIWKNQKVENTTFYAYSSEDGLMIKFHCDKGSKSWDFYLTFTGYVFDNFEHISKKKSDDLYLAVTKVKQYLDLIKPH